MRFKLFLFSLVKLIDIFNYSNANEILGCGGFIKSHTSDIDFSKVEIKLLTKQGSLKDKTDCSPSNGYYFIPIYDKGEYLLQIAPPPGWSFTPEYVELNFNGKTDICSQGKDVNFVFNGFGITGRVLIENSSLGAKGVTVTLKSDDGQISKSSETDLNGVFSFTPIIPGKYALRASHSTWHFSKSDHEVLVKSGNTILPENSLLVGGFNVNGNFKNVGQLHDKIEMVLLTSTNNKWTEIDQVKLNKNGNYMFKAVARGKYIIRPKVLSQELKLNIEPSEINFEVERDNVNSIESFEINGFNLSGRVLSAINGQGVPNAKIFINDKITAETNADGSYTLKNIQEGVYSIKVTAENREFEEQNIKILLHNPKIPDIIATGFRVCGNIVSQKSYNVVIRKVDSNFERMVASKSGTGDWCTYLGNGKYSFEVLTSDDEKSKGIQFFPIKQFFQINGVPFNGITFSQLRAKVTGKIQCLSSNAVECQNIEITLNSLDAMGQLTGKQVEAAANNGEYIFEDILPGPYEVTIPESRLCFESSRQFINVNSSSETIPMFKHTGYKITIHSSHRTKMTYQQQSKQTQKSTIPSTKIILEPGVNTFCVSEDSDYTFSLESCHIFDSLPKTFSTSNPNPIILKASAHKTGFRVLSPGCSLGSLKLLIEKETGEKDIVSLTTDPEKINDQFSCRYETYLKEEETITVTPQSSLLLFQPESKEIIGGTECVDIAFSFVAIKGLIISGKVSPAIDDVKITLSFPENPTIQTQEIMTTKKGEFAFAPIDERLKYDLKAEKISYVFTEYDRVNNVFKAHKLCDIIVNVKDDAGNKLNGVLLSLSGAESYRKNLVTGDDGTIKFHSLSPSQYFLRPMMKEYKFEPNSKIIDVKNGETAKVDLVGKRSAYSIFGQITSLNSDPFPNVILEAISDDKCMHHQEETSSENNGQYRIRGLQPGCRYTVQVKQDETNTNVDRTIPLNRNVDVEKGDTNDINFIAISPINFVDVTVHVYASSNEFYKTLRIQIYRKGNADSPIYSQRVESPLNPKLRLNAGSLVFFPRIPLDEKTYYVELKTTLSDQMYKYYIPVASFSANTSSIYLEFKFEPEIRVGEGDLNQNSFSALILVALVAITFFKQEIAMELLNFIWSKLNLIFDDLMQRFNANKKEIKYVETAINYKEIEQIADGINSIKKKKTKKI